MTKSGREIMEILEAFDLTGTAWSAAQLTGCDAKTVARYVRGPGCGPGIRWRAARPRLIDGFLPKLEELVDRSKGKIRADVAHRRSRRWGPGVGAVDPAGGRGVKRPGGQARRGATGRGSLL